MAHSRLNQDRSISSFFGLQADLLGTNLCKVWQSGNASRSSKTSEVEPKQTILLKQWGSLLNHRLSDKPPCKKLECKMKGDYGCFSFG